MIKRPAWRLKPGDYGISMIPRSESPPILKLADGVVQSMCDEVFNDGYCETCSNYTTRLSLTIKRDSSEKLEYIDIDETDGAKAFTFVMRHLESIPSMTLNAFISALRRPYG